MRHYPRKPVIAVLLAACLASAAAVFAVGAWGERAGGRPTLAELASAVAHEDASAQVWVAYADRLCEAGEYGHAADAYEKALQVNPLNRDARLGCGVALARAQDAAGLYAWAQRLIYTDPKLACELLDRPECAGYLSQERFAKLRQEARFQNMD